MANGSATIQSAGLVNSTQQAWIYQQFNGTTFQANAMDVQHEPLWDQLSTAAGGTISVGQQSFFNNPSGKTPNQTNVTKPNQLQAPEAFTVMGITFTWQPTMLLADLVLIRANLALQFWIGQKSYNYAPVEFYNYGSGISGFGTVSGTQILTNGQPMKGERHMLAINIVIDNQASFYGSLVGVSTTLTASGSGGSGAVLQMLLDGLHARGVQ